MVKRGQKGSKRVKKGQKGSKEVKIGDKWGLKGLKVLKQGSPGTYWPKGGGRSKGGEEFC